MFRKKLAFTLAETIICMLIIGVVILATLGVAKQKADDYKRHYITAYKAISNAFFNGIMIHNKNPFAKDISHSATNDVGTERLCQALTTFINTNNNDVTKDHDIGCSPKKITSQKADSFEDKNIQFVSTNGMKFYLSNLIADGTTTPFYLIFVDLNGDKGPNSIVKEKKHPDIVAFAALNSGKVVPIGRPEFDKTYMTARLTYTNSIGEAVYGDKPVAYYQAKGQAWGFYSDNTVNVQTDVNKNEPFTLNDVIRSNIVSDSLIYDEYPTSLSELEPMPVLDTEPTYCSAEDIDTCYVSIDEYNY